MCISRQFWISLAIVVFAGAILVVVVISWNSVPGWQQVPGGPWILIGAAAVSVAAFVRNALQIVKIVSDLYREANIEADELSEMLVEILRTLVQVARQNNTTTVSCSIDSGTSSKGKYRLLIQDPSRGNDISIEELDMDPLQALVDRGYLLPVNQSAYELLSSAFEAFGHS